MNRLPDHVFFYRLGFYTKNPIDIKSFVGGAIFSSTYEY